MGTPAVPYKINAYLVIGRMRGRIINNICKIANAAQVVVKRPVRHTRRAFHRNTGTLLDAAQYLIRPFSN